MEAIYLWAQLVQLLWIAGLTVVTWLRKPGMDAEAAVKTLQDELGRDIEAYRQDVDRRLLEHAERLTRIDAHLEHMPSSEAYQ